LEFDFPPLPPHLIMDVDYVCRICELENERISETFTVFEILFYGVAYFLLFFFLGRFGFSQHRGLAAGRRSAG